MNFYDVRRTNGRKCNLHRQPHEPKIHEFKVGAFSCRPPCVCDGYEVCLHHLGPWWSSPIWPVFNAASEAEAREIAKKVLLFARSMDPKAETMQVVEALRAWAVANGWHEAHHIVWRRRAATSTEATQTPATPG